MRGRTLQGIGGHRSLTATVDVFGNVDTITLRAASLETTSARYVGVVVSPIAS